MTRKFTLRSKGRLLEILEPQIWGVVNYTPDSFYPGSRRPEHGAAFAEAKKHLEEGADVIDIGAMSSRPGAGISDPEKEINLLLPLIEEIKTAYPDSWISIDTIHSQVAHKCLENGADIINDITGGHYDPEILPVIGEYKVPAVLMHMRGTPATMQDEENKKYEDIVRTLMLYFNDRIRASKKAGINDIILDPGFGFSKTAPQNMQLIEYIPSFKIFDRPVLIGVSRKSTIYRTLGITPEESLNGTTALHMIALYNGADILRVHDVKEAKETVTLYNLYRNSGEDPVKPQKKK